MQHHHLLYAAGPVLVSHLEIVTVTASSEQNHKIVVVSLTTLAVTRVRLFSDRHLDR